MNRDEAFEAARAVERGDQPSGSVILPLTGPGSLSDPATMAPEPLPYDVSWEYLSVEADSPEEAAQKAMSLLMDELAATGRLRFVVQQPDANDDYSEVDVTPNGEVL